MPTSLEQAIKQKARALGFDNVGISDATLSRETSDNLHKFIANEFHGDMAWLANRASERENPSSLWPAAKSVIMLAVNYAPDDDPMKNLAREDIGVISVYAQNKDYHDVIKKRLKSLARWFCEKTAAEVKVFVDTAPVMEKPLAARAGMGWQGKHTNLVSRSFGSWLFLGAIFTTAELKADEKEADHCGACRRCLDICPTNAFPAPYKLDARRCISYLTIEHKGPIPVSLRKKIGNRIYGCDDCLAVCPWNKFAKKSEESAFHAREKLRAPKLHDLAVLSDADFRDLFSGSPIKRTGRDRFIRNILIALGNGRDRNALAIIDQLSNDESPLVRGAAAWALQEILPTDEFSRRRKIALLKEDNQDVRMEWKST